MEAPGVLETIDLWEMEMPGTFGIFDMVEKWRRLVVLKFGLKMETPSTF